MPLYRYTGRTQQQQHLGVLFTTPLCYILYVTLYLKYLTLRCINLASTKYSDFVFSA